MSSFIFLFIVSGTIDMRPVKMRSFESRTEGSAAWLVSGDTYANLALLQVLYSSTLLFQAIISPGCFVISCLRIQEKPGTIVASTLTGTKPSSKQTAIAYKLCAT